VTAEVPPADQPAATRGPTLRLLARAGFGWPAGLLLVAALVLVAVDRIPPALALLPLGALAAFLAVRAASEWPRVGYPACILGVASYSVAAGLFHAGVRWTREWEALRNAGDLPVAAGASPWFGLALAIALGGAFLAVLFLHGETVWRNLSTVRLAVVTLTTIGIGAVAGTMFVQRGNAGQRPEEEKQFIEKFMKGQGGIPVNAGFMVSPPDVALTPQESEFMARFSATFGADKAKELRMEILHSRELVAKAAAIEAHVDRRREHLLRFYERSEAIGLTDIFRSWWFNSLLVLVAVQVIAVLSRRYPWGWSKAGWVITHNGVIVILLGCVLSDGFLRDGFATLSPDEATDRYFDTTVADAQGNPVPRELGFRVRMLGTDQTFHHKLEVAVAGDAAGERFLQRTEPLRPGGAIEVTDPDTGRRYEVRVLEVQERARRGPAVCLEYLHAAGEGASGKAEQVIGERWLLSDPMHSELLPGGFLRYLWATSAAELDGIRTGAVLAGQGRYGTLFVRLPGGKGTVTARAEPGLETEARDSDGAAWGVKVKRFFWNHRVGREMPPEDDATALAINPALEVEVRRGEGPWSPMLVYGDPGRQQSWETMAHEPAGGMTTRYGKGAAGECSYAFSFSPPFQQWLLDAAGASRVLVTLERGKEPVAVDFSRPGTRAPLGRAGEFTVRLRDAVPGETVQSLPPETDEEYLEASLRALEGGGSPPPTTMAARLQLTELDRNGKTPRTRSDWMFPSGREVDHGHGLASDDGRLRLELIETNAAAMYRSALEVQSLKQNPDGSARVLARQVVRVNNPLQWAGYAFFQSEFNGGDDQTPPSSGFRVKYDRGVPTVYAGFLVLTAGVMMMLWFDPLFRRRRGAAGEGGRGTVDGPPA